MNEFITLVDKIYPLYLIVVGGYLAGRFLKADRHTVSSILIYIIAPVVIFHGVTSAPQNDAFLLLPVIFFATAFTLSVSFYAIGSRFWKSGERNILSFMAGSGNTGYFGLPLILSLFGQRGLSVAVFAVFGSILYESTRGYYIIARHHFSAEEAAGKVLKLPVLYAFTLGVIANKLDVHFGSSIQSVFQYFNGAYTVLGMMILGIGLAAVTKTAFDRTFIAISFTAKFLCFPAIMAALVYLDASTLHFYDAEVHKIMMILSVVPIATNAVTYASYLKVHPEKAAFTVMMSTVFSLIYIPVFISIFLK